MKSASQARTVLCVGDVHGRWAWLASILLSCQPDVCLCAGDFGWFPRLIQPPSLALPREVLGRTEIRVCDGNHEDTLPCLLLLRAEASSPSSSRRVLSTSHGVPPWIRPTAAGFSLPGAPSPSSDASGRGAATGSLRKSSSRGTCPRLCRRRTSSRATPCPCASDCTASAGDAPSRPA